jgi:hypothetical protein
MAPRVPLYDRLPEIYRIEDLKVEPAGQLEAYLGLVEDALGHVHANIEGLYDDLFIESCDAWVIPYIGDLLGTSHLTGDEWTLRADVADTIALRRRKGTLAGIERLAFDLTRWGVHAVELRERLVWNQHLNHQRPDRGGEPAYGNAFATRFTPIRGGTVALRDPAMLSLLTTPFDPFAHVVDVKPAAFGALRHNLPNLAIFLWRLEDFRVVASRPAFEATVVGGGGVHLVRLHAHPMGEPLRLFNTYQFDPTLDPPVITSLDGTPGPIPTARLSERSEAGRPDHYFAVDVYDETDASAASRDLADVGLQLHVPESAFPGRVWEAGGPKAWHLRGENLCAWESGLLPPMVEGDIAVDPVHGRIMIAVADAAEASALEDHLLVTHTYGAVGPVGAHPRTRTSIPEPWATGAVTRVVDLLADPGFTLEDALTDIHLLGAPLVVEIRDSLTHDLEIGAILGTIPEDGGFNLLLNAPVMIRSSDGQRPVVRLHQPLRFRPNDPADAGDLTLRLEGLYVTRGPLFPADAPLVARAALHRLEIVECTLDPGGSLDLDGTALGGRTPIRTALDLRQPYGFDPADEDAFAQTPEIVLRQVVCGPLRIDEGYRLWLTQSVVDGGRGVGDPLGPPVASHFAVTGATDPVDGWGPATEVSGVTFMGRTRVARINGRGGIWVHALEVLNDQVGCIRYSYFSGAGDRLPQNLGCVTAGPDARLSFVDERFGRPGHAQLATVTARAIREDGPGSNEMGAFGFLEEAHKWRNLQIRFREFMPVGVRPLLIPVT